ncbi:radical SAM protein [Mangrovibacterium lignilyticum]|uniref:radical SAM protein n=1 Tax=Mangrovibacterium lignilyticum TaxID=2668052 RepID=UPI0013D46925|nr:radical SAM protein [Mangrovibacterium lignilyticum]
MLRNQEEYQVKYNYLKFPSPDEAANAMNERQAILSAIGDRVQWGFHQSKVDVTKLSRGCQLCGEGEWSCLFINNLCNGKCFYCPTQQTDLARPETNTLVFDEPEAYVEYIREFGFKGVSISGGEPLISFEKSLAFVQAVKAAFGDEVYVWLYTNGILLTPEKVEAFKQAGLNEMRFDIGATEYKTDKLKLAVGQIPVVTVEIPAVPQEEELLKAKIRELKDLGLSHLNFHQMRLTPYNFNELIEYDYTYTHGEKVTVIDSELTALRLIQFTLDEGIDLPINYCSFVYKNRHQKSANRKKHAPIVIYPWEQMTENGFIRNLFTKISPDQKEIVLNAFDTEIAAGKANFNAYSGRLDFHVEQFEKIKELELPVWLAYHVSHIFPQATGMNDFETIYLNGEKEVVVERTAAALPLLLDAGHLALLDQVLEGKGKYAELMDAGLQQIMTYEFIPEGLGDYF